MKISNRVKRNISMTLFGVGLACCAYRIWNVAMAPTSGRAWFELCGMVVLTYLCFDSYLTYRRKINQGIK